MKKIYLLHGWVYTTEKWNPVVEELKKIGFECEILPIPGLTSPIDKPWTLEDYVGWLNDFFADKEKPILLGHSNGGRIAIAFNAKYPEKLGQLILVDSAGLIDRRLKPALKRFVFRHLAKIGKTFTKSEKLRKILYGATNEKDYHEASPIMKETMANLISSDLAPDLSKITAPTLIIWGKDDKSTPLFQGKYIHQMIKGSKIKIIEDANHSPHVSHPKMIAEIISEELK